MRANQTEVVAAINLTVRHTHSHTYIQKYGFEQMVFFGYNLKEHFKRDYFHA